MAAQVSQLTVTVRSDSFMSRRPGEADALVPDAVVSYNGMTVRWTHVRSTAMPLHSPGEVRHWYEVTITGDGKHRVDERSFESFLVNGDGTNREAVRGFNIARLEKRAFDHAVYVVTELLESACAEAELHAHEASRR